MKSEIISAHYTIYSDQNTVDLFYFFDSLNLQIYIDGKVIHSVRLTPSRYVLNYNNILEVANRYLDSYKLKLKQKENELLQ